MKHVLELTVDEFDEAASKATNAAKAFLPTGTIYLVVLCDGENIALTRSNAKPENVPLYLREIADQIEESNRKGNFVVTTKANASAQIKPASPVVP